MKGVQYLAGLAMVSSTMKNLWHTWQDSLGSPPRKRGMMIIPVPIIGIGHLKEKKLHNVTKLFLVQLLRNNFQVSPFTCREDGLRRGFAALDSEQTGEIPVDKFKRRLREVPHDACLTVCFQMLGSDIVIKN